MQSEEVKKLSEELDEIKSEIQRIKQMFTAISANWRIIASVMESQGNAIARVEKLLTQLDELPTDEGKGR